MNGFSLDWLLLTLRNAAPLVTVLFAGLVATLPWPFVVGSSTLTGTAPDLAFMAVYFWRMVRPDLLRPSAVFLVGFLLDALSGAPLGMSSLAYLIAILMVGRLAQVIVPLSGLFWFGGFVLAAATVTVLSWVVVSLWSLSFVPLLPLAVSLIWTVLLYPLMGMALMLVMRLLVPTQVAR